jgi:hypothetical protein
MRMHDQRNVVFPSIKNVLATKNIFYNKVLSTAFTQKNNNLLLVSLQLSE